MPCDVGGLDACPYWLTHEASPGQPVAWLDELAFDVYEQIQRHGWPLVAALRQLDLTGWAADALFWRLDWLTQHLPAIMREWRGVEPATPETTRNGDLYG